RWSGSIAPSLAPRGVISTRSPWRTLRLPADPGTMPVAAIAAAPSASAARVAASNGPDPAGVAIASVGSQLGADVRERPVGALERLIDRRLVVGGAHEPVVDRVQVDAVARACVGPRAGACELGVVAEQQQRHLRRPRHRDVEAMGRRLGAQPLLEALAGGA